MRKQKKSRVETVGVQMFKGFIDSYYMTIPYDKKDRIIPSSVECAYNLRYFDLQETVNMLRSL
jgi:urate oxidase